MSKRPHTSAPLLRSGRGLAPRAVIAGALLVAASALACVGPSVKPGPKGKELKTLAQETGADDAIRRDPPIALTAADGAELPLRALHVKAVLDQPLAFTELELLFDNPEGRTLAGRLALAIPPGARVTRFATFREGAWQEAEVVPRRAAYQQLALGREPQEPQLVGAAEGERFVARVEAVAAKEPTRIMVAYVQEMRGRSEPYRVALAGLGQLRELGIKLRARGPLTIAGDPAFSGVRGDGEFARFGEIRPVGDFIVNPQGPRELGLRHENMVVARISPVPHDHPAPLDNLSILFDTSASQSLGWDTHVDRLGLLIAELGARVIDDVPLRVVCFDQGVEIGYDGTLRKFAATDLEAIRARRPLGASNLAGALRFAAGVGERPPGRMILMTDGLVTAGAQGEAQLLAEAERLRAAGVGRVDVIVEGGAADPVLLKTLTSLTRLSPSHPGLVLRSGVSPRIAAHRLTRSVVPSVEVRVPGSEWVYPAKLEAVQAGDDVLVYADLREEEDRLDVELVGPEIAARRAVTLARSPSPLLDDAWSGARAAWLIDQARGCDRELGDTCDRWRARAVEFSRQNRIVNETTAMVVLGSADDYARFGLADRRGEVLSVGQFGVEWRPAEALPPATVAVSAPRPHALLADLRWGGPDWDAQPAAGRPSPPPMPDRSNRSRRTGPERPVREASRPAPPEAGPGRLRDRDKDADAGLHFGPRRTPEDAYEGNFLAVMNLLAAWNDKQNALGVAQRWQHARPADVAAIVALGEALEANGRPELAARAYGSLIDVYPGRPEIRRLAAARLERTGDAAGWLVLDAYGRAVEQRYDDPAGHRLYAYALLRAGYFAEAWAALLDALAWARVDPKTQPIERVLAEDLGLVAAAWIRRWPDQEEYVLENLRVQEIELPTRPSLRFVLSWDGLDADVDLHVRDGNGWHAFYREKVLPSGGRLLGDVEAGYGLEAFVIEGEQRAYPYRLEVGYYGRTPGLGSGKVQVVEHDGGGELKFVDRPFIVLKQRGYVDLGAVAGPLAPAP